MQTIAEMALAGRDVECTPIHLGVTGISKRFGKFEALKGISLDVREGEFVCLLGPSGCGKTTLLRIVAGLDVQDEGRVFLGGRDVSHLPPGARDYGIVFQSYALFPNLTVAANIGYGLVNRRRAKREVAARVAELLELVGLQDQGAKYPVQLSGGQQQRVALARALAPSPSLLLLDEPLSALDARVRARLRDEIKDLQRRLGVTTIMVTHDQEEALALADRIVVMNRGVIEQIGTPAEVYATPATAFVADFVGVMNLIAATVVDARAVEILGRRFCVSRMPDGLPPGANVRVGFRPEDVRVRDIAEAENPMSAHVAGLDFLGPFCRVALSVRDVAGLTITADVSATVVRDLGIEEGRLLEIGLARESLRIFAGDAPAA